MGYRDELEAAHSRIAALESELSSIKAKEQQALVVREQDTLVAAQAKKDALSRRVLGAATQVIFECSLNGELPEQAFGIIADRARDRIQLPGNLSMLPGSMTWTTGTWESKQLELRVTARRGKTTIRLLQRLNNTAAATFVVAGAGGFMGTVVAGAVLGPLGLAAAALVLPVLLLGARDIFKLQASSSYDKIQALGRELQQIAHDEIVAKRASD